MKVFGSLKSALSLTRSAVVILALIGVTGLVAMIEPRARMNAENMTLCSINSAVTEGQKSTLSQPAEFFSGLLDTSLWPARWYCGNWSEFHGWLYIFSDAMIALSYFLIPLILVYFLYKKKGQKPALRVVVVLFVLFILACGLTHVMDASLFWWPAYRLSALIRFVTAGISVGTVFALIKVSPSLLQLKSVEYLEQVIDERTEELRSSLSQISAYKRALDESSIVSIADHLGIIRHVNDNFCKISKYSADDLIGKDHRIINSSHHSKEFMQTLWATALAGAIWKGELKNKASDGTTYWVDTTIVPFLNEHNEPYQYLAISSDVTARKETELRDAFLASIVNSSEDAILSIDRESMITTWNNAASKVFGYSGAEALGKHVSFLFPDDKFDHESNVVDKIVQGQYVKPYETTRKRKNGTLIPVSVNVSPIHDAGGNVIGASKSARDITYRIKIQEEQLRLAEIVRNSFNEVYVFDRETLQFEFANQAALSNLGYSLEEIKSIHPLVTLSGKHHRQFKGMLKELNERTAEFVIAPLQHVRKDGTLYEIEKIVQLSANGKSYVAIGTDITSKLNTESNLVAVLAEKETLIKEIHHRVKNNLQLISSILYIKMKGIEESDTKSFLEETQRTIRSIALIHERLLQTQSVDQVDAADYLGKLILDLRMIISKQELTFRIASEIEPGLMNLDTAVYCGLIINELITNSIKHAFKNRTEGDMSVNLRKCDGRHVLVAGDNGVSLPAGVEPGKTNSFGMQLLDIFIKQLKGTFKIDREAGTKFIIQFP